MSERYSGATYAHWKKTRIPLTPVNWDTTLNCKRSTGFDRDTEAMLEMAHKFFSEPVEVEGR